MSQNADVIFAAGGNTGNGGLLAIVEKGGTVLGIGVDTDQYLSLPEAKSILVSSAMKLITPGRVQHRQGPSRTARTRAATSPATWAWRRITTWIRRCPRT